ncbi:MAG: DUF2179 domain-containing protein [Planctomycetota bacterium]|nr:MAG: DUF2179 domain-containing protein [Planctomycetota bacterium]
MFFFSSETFTFVILPILIFVARICDVTIGTIRIIFVSRGQKYLAPLVGFFEILIWLVAIGKVMQNLNNVFCYVAYAGGFAAGNFIGIYIEEKIAMGTLVIQIITRKDASELIKNLKLKGYGTTSIPAEGSTGRVHIIYTVIKRSSLTEVVEIIKRFNPKAFYSIEDVKFVKEGIFPLRKPYYHKGALQFGRLFRVRKGK